MGNGDPCVGLRLLLPTPHSPTPFFPYDPRPYVTFFDAGQDAL
jgi:hypothetical protein